MDADPSTPHLEGAAYDIGRKAVHEDRKHNIRIRLKEEIRCAYRIAISPL
jgi:hypothetical protein